MGIGPRFYEGEEDCQWLRETALRYYNDVVPAFESFVLRGNEDCPDGIDLYREVDPNYDTVPVLSLAYGDGRYVIDEEDEQ